jgi:hypothetical protein
MVNLSRRQLLISSLSLASAFTLGGVYWFHTEESIPSELDDDSQWQFLTKDQRLVLSVIVPVIIQSTEITKDVLTVEQVKQQLQRIDQAIMFLTATQKQDLLQLLEGLTSKFSRLILTSSIVNWNRVSATEVQEVLIAWRYSMLALLQYAYLSLKELIYAAWYGDPNQWSAIDYPGPPKLFG